MMPDAGGQTWPTASAARPFVFPAGAVRYAVGGGRIGDGVFIEVDAAKAARKP